MAKTNATFKLGKMVKLSMGSTFNKAERLAYKNLMVDAQATFVAQKGRKFSDPATAQRGNNRPAPTQETQS
jgi:hypothetical protein